MKKENYDAYSGSAICIDGNCEVKESNYIGEVGSKSLIEGELIEIKEITTSWGDTTVFTIRTVDGDIVEKMGVLASKFVVDGKSVVEGCKIAFNGTVKKHSEYKGEKKTIISTLSMVS